MALDNANFIAELSITDPPGTDPLSQGDDHIRTVKRATQQSFPNIDKAVSLTADQMNEVAIKNEANRFTTTNIFDDSISINSAADNARNLFFTAVDINIWSIQMQAVAGNNRSLRLRKHNNTTGAFEATVFEVDYDTNVVDFTNVPTVQGAPLWVAGELRMFAAAATPGTNWFVADGTNGTVNCADRWLVGSGAFSGTVGNGLDAELNTAQAAAGTTGSTALTEAQMPAHDHRIWSGNVSGITDVTFDTANTVVGANRGNTGPKYDRTAAGSGAQIIEDTGGGAGHTHTSPAQNVSIGSPTFTNSVQPLSRIVDIYQYVP